MKLLVRAWCMVCSDGDQWLEHQAAVEIPIARFATTAVEYFKIRYMAILEIFNADIRVYPIQWYWWSACYIFRKNTINMAIHDSRSWERSVIPFNVESRSVDNRAERWNKCTYILVIISMYQPARKTFFNLFFVQNIRKK